MAAAHTFSSVAANAANLFTYSGGIQAIAANGPVSLQAHTDQLEILADQAIIVISVSDCIEIKAKEKIVLQHKLSLPPDEAAQEQEQSELMQGMGVLAEQMQMLAQQTQMLLRAVTAPKELVRDQNGRAIGARVVMDDNEEGQQ